MGTAFLNSITGYEGKPFPVTFVLFASLGIFYNYPMPITAGYLAIAIFVWVVLCLAVIDTLPKNDR